MEKSPLAVSRARALRKAETSSEAKLWGYLRGRRLGEFKFRRQVPIPPYIADFACLSHGLIIEVDGATHGDLKELEYDERRTEYLKTKGFTVYRVNSCDVYHHMTDVLDGISMALQRQKKNHPSPDGRRMLPHPTLAKFYNTL
jgi:very-short-patch-repair endonuclease